MATKIETVPATAPVAAQSAAAARAAEAVIAKAPVAKVKRKYVKSATPKALAKVAAAKIKGTSKMTDTVKNAAAEAGEKAQSLFNDFTARAKTAFEKSGETVKDVAEFNKANMEAVVESMKIVAKGTQTAAQHAADYGRKNFDATSAMLKDAAAVKSPTDFFKLQGDFARSQFEGAVAEMSRVSEFNLKLAGEIFQPIQNRYAVAAEKVKSFAA